MRTARRPKCCSTALKQWLIDASSVTSSWIGLILVGAPRFEVASSALWTSREPIKIWYDGYSEDSFFTISKPMPVLPPIHTLLVVMIFQTAGRELRRKIDDSSNHL